MSKKFKIVALLLVVMLALSILSVGCGKKTDTEPGTTTVVSTEASTTAVTVKEKVTIKWFYPDFGLVKPEGVDRDNSEWVKLIEEKANVDLQIECPPWSELTAGNDRYNLMLASGDIPDLVSAGSNQKDIMTQAARQGAFIDLRQYYDNAVSTKKWVSPEIMDNVKDDQTGKNFYLVMAYNTTYQGGGNEVRLDLIQKYNGGVIPDTVDGYIDFLRKIKAADPTSVPISTRPGFFYGGSIYNWYGVPFVSPWREYQVRDGKVVNMFTLPEFAEATNVYRQLYKEGIFDKEWATNDSAKAVQKLENNNWALRDTAAEDLLSWQQNEKTRKGGFIGQRWILCPELKSYPAGVDPKRTWGNGTLPYLPYYGTYISDKSKTPDRAFDVLEALSSDEVYEAVIWGKEGSEYTINNGVRVPDTAKLNNENRSWAQQFGMVFGLNQANDIMYLECRSIYNNDADFKLFEQGFQTAAAKGKERGPNFMDQMPSIEEVSTLSTEGDPYIMEAVTKAILGTISMDEFKNMQAIYAEKYGNKISELYTAELNKNKDKWLKMGINEAGW